MANGNDFKVEVEALDAGQGYLVRGKFTIDNVVTAINEHYDTEAEVRTRLGSGFDVWAGQVDSEPTP